MRRVFLDNLHPGDCELPEEAYRHLVQVLRMGDGSEVEVFDRSGAVARGVLRVTGSRASVEVGTVSQAAGRADTPRIRIASAVPKGERADWMVEKLAELGVAEWRPLETERSVVLPRGTGKRDRWERIAREAARQSSSAGVMSVGELTPLEVLLRESGVRPGGSQGWFGSTGRGEVVRPALATWADGGRPVWVVIGPEGGLTDDEEARLRSSGWVGVGFGETVLRVETCAVVAAAVVVQLWGSVKA